MAYGSGSVVGIKGSSNGDGGSGWVIITTI